MKYIIYLCLTVVLIFGCDNRGMDKRINELESRIDRIDYDTDRAGMLLWDFGVRIAKLEPKADFYSNVKENGGKVIKAEEITRSDSLQEKYFHTNFEISEDCVEAIKRIQGVESASNYFKYKVSVYIGSCFAWKDIEPKIMETLFKAKSIDNQ